MLIWAISAK